MRRSIKKFFTISTIAFVILYPCLFMYFQNADEAKLIDALPAFEKFLALAIVVFIICIIFMKNTGKAVLASDVILFILTNFNVFLSKVDHVIGRKKIIVILFFIIILEYNKIEKTKWESLCDSVINLVFSLGRDHCSDVCISGRKNLSGTSICIYLSAEHLCSSF